MDDIVIWYFYALQNDHNKSVYPLTIKNYYNIIDCIPYAS